MREYFVMKENGVGMIIDARNEDEAWYLAGPGVVSLEETRESKQRHFVPDAVFSSHLVKPADKWEERVDKAIAAVNRMKHVSAWERKFVYGLKRYLKTNHRLSPLQTEKLNQLAGKWGI